MLRDRSLRNLFRDHDLFFRDGLPGLRIHDRDDCGKVSVHRAAERYTALYSRKRRDLHPHIGLRPVVPQEIQMISPALGERGGIKEFKDIPFHISHANRSVDEADDFCSDRRRAVRIEHAVHAEVPVMLPLAVIASVGITSVLMEYGVIHHLPDTSAHQIVIVIDFLPVRFRIAGTDSHRVGILTHKVRPVIQALHLSSVLTGPVHHIHARIHLAAHIVSLPLTVDRALVVDRNIRLRSQVVVHCIRIVITARLVAEGPHNYGSIGMELIALVQTLNAVHVTGLPLRIVAYGIVGGRELHDDRSVGLQIIFIHNIYTHLVSHLQKERVRRIVRCPDRINIKFLAQSHIALDLIRRQGVSVSRTRVMVIYTLELDLMTVQIEYILMDLHRLKADSLLNAGCRCLKIYIIEDRIFGTPFSHIEVFKCDRSALPICPNSLASRDPVAFKRKCHVRIGQSLRGELQAVFARSFLRHRIKIPEIGRLGDSEQNISENTVVAEHILALQIGACAPAVYHCQKLILTLFEIPGQIEFRSVVSALGVTYKGSVHIEIKAARYAQEGDDIILLIILNLDLFAVYADKIVFFARVFIPKRHLLVHAHDREYLSYLLLSRYDRRMVGELVADIHIERMIVAAELPAGRNIDRVKFHVIRIQEIGQFCRSRIEPEVPVTVQTLYFFRLIALIFERDPIRSFPGGIRNEVASAGKLIFLDCIKIAVIALIQIIFHDDLLCCHTVPLTDAFCDYRYPEYTDSALIAGCIKTMKLLYTKTGRVDTSIFLSYTKDTVFMDTVSQGIQNPMRTGFGTKHPMRAGFPLSPETNFLRKQKHFIETY